MKLLVSQKNAIFDLIENFEFSPYQFEILEIATSKMILEIPSSKPVTAFYTELRYKNSDYFFRFESKAKGKIAPYDYVVFCPSYRNYMDQEDTKVWERQLDLVAHWLRHLSSEVSSSNKWERLDHEIKSININFDNEEDKFSVHEYEDLVRKINTLKDELPKIGLLSEQLDVINSKLDHLTELAKNLNKFDWKGLFIGTIIGIVIQLEVTPTNAQSLWALIQHIFQSRLLP